MKKRAAYIITLFISIASSSCSNSDFDIAPVQQTKTAQVQESISINGVPTSKKSDVYSSAKSAEKSSSSFLLQDNKNSSLTISISNEVRNIKNGSYSFDLKEVNIEVTNTNNEWSTSKGHQKGAYFEVISVRNLASNSDYIKEINVKANCFLYNNEGNFIPFECLTSIKF